MIVKREWIIILIKEPQLEYYAFRSMGILPGSDIQLKDGRVVKSDDYEVLVNDLTAKEALFFMALPTYVKDQILADLEATP